MRMLLTAALLVAALPMAADPIPGPAYTVTGQGLITVNVLPAMATLKHEAGALNFGDVTSSGAVQTFTVAPRTAAADLFTFTKDYNEVADIKVDTKVSILGGTTGAVDTVLVHDIAGNASGSTSGSISVGGTFTLPAYAKKFQSYMGYNVTLSYSQW